MRKITDGSPFPPFPAPHFISPFPPPPKGEKRKGSFWFAPLIQSKKVKITGNLGVCVY
jgi:hypothetical protein